MNIKTIKHAVKSFVAALKTKNIVAIPQVTDLNGLLKDRVALVLGGSGGIGFAIAKSFHESGCKVIIAGTNENKLSACLSEMNGTAKSIVINMLDVKTFNSKIKEAVSYYGKIDIVVNSAGVHSTKAMTDFMNVTEQEYDMIMNVNLKGCYFFMQTVAKYMVENKIKGHILNISSSVCAEPAWSPYRLSKLGIKGLTLGMAQKLSPYGIIVNCIAPGSTATPLLDVKDGDTIYTDDNILKRYILPLEVTQYAKLLVSDLGNMIVGDTLFISGGRGTFDIR